MTTIRPPFKYVCDGCTKFSSENLYHFPMKIPRIEIYYRTMGHVREDLHYCEICSDKIFKLGLLPI